MLFRSEMVEVKFISSVTKVQKENFYIALDFNLQPGWKIYWRQPGDSGMPPNLDYKNSNNELNYFVYDKSINSTPKKKIITKSQIINNRRIFKYVLLPNDFFKIQRKISKKLIEVNKIVKFHIGYVSGNKKYFHPDNLTIKKYGITRKNIIKTIADTKLLKEIGVFTSNIKEENLNNLFYPIKISKPEQKYIDFGKKEKINNQHKCKIRNNWYMVPIVKVPDYVISVFNEFPLMVYNDKNLIATNTFLCGYSNDYKNKKILLNGWYNSLTKLFLELEIHSLGGGMLIMVPKEIGKIKIPFINKINKNFINKINKYIKENDYKKAMKIGDKVILNDFLQLNDKEIKIIHKSIKILQYWRNLK